jgi:hypothetical protein
VLSGRRTVQELVDRNNIRHQGIRQLLLDYLRRRKPSADRPGNDPADPDLPRRAHRGGRGRSREG